VVGRIGASIAAEQNRARYERRCNGAHESGEFHAAPSWIAPCWMSLFL
jgi:hypothetical protein